MSERAIFIQLLREHDHGRAWLCALAHGQSALACGPDKWIGMFKRAYGLFAVNAAAGHRATPRMAWQAVELALKERPSRVVSTAPDFGSNDASLAYTHVTTTVVMESYHVKGLTEAMAGTFAWRPGTDDGHRLKLLAPLIEKMHFDGLFSAQPNAVLGVQRLWVSSSGLAGEPVDPPKRSPASFQRDYRGLIHLSNFDFLVGYVLDVSYFPAICRPNVLDGAGVRFRSWSDQRADGDTFGSAVDLHRLAAENEQLDGAPEAIVPSVPFDLRALLDVVPLGHPGPWDPWVGQRGLEEGIDDHKAFADRIEREANVRGIPVAGLLKSMEDDINGGE